MLKSPSSRFDPLEIGSTVRVSIPDVDRARGAPRNLLAVVLDVENDLYKLVPCKEKLLDIPKFIKEKELTLREAAGLSSISGTQGYQRCHCKTKCKNNKCACRSSGKLCNSKCHGSLPCENK
ncbi:unnamed protein product [Macrosiphum euphorbiae]|uniref:Uncharacterized protein n=1 Tax=Macrosiphum euphorbiae TaxID=13131 RepID=A0AAV0Y8M6_9HEMI|nr:unnamed protein product [Macrosiphum euphorbiae]